MGSVVGPNDPPIASASVPEESEARAVPPEESAKAVDTAVVVEPPGDARADALGSLLRGLPDTVGSDDGAQPDLSPATEKVLERLAEGLFGKDGIPAAQVPGMFLEALKNVPVGDLEGSRLLGSLRGRSSLTGTSFSSARGKMREASKDWIDDNFGSYLKEHAHAVALIGAGTATAARAASPDVAKTMDSLVSSDIPLLTRRTADESVQGTVAVHYRDGRILPDVELDARASRPLGSRTIFTRAEASLPTIDGKPEGSLGAGIENAKGGVEVTAAETVSAEAEQRVEGRLAATMRIGDGKLRGTGAASRDVDDPHDLSASLGVAYESPLIGISAQYELPLSDGPAELRIGLSVRRRW